MSSGRNNHPDSSPFNTFSFPSLTSQIPHTLRHSLPIRQPPSPQVQIPSYADRPQFHPPPPYHSGRYTNSPSHFTAQPTTFGESSNPTLQRQHNTQQPHAESSSFEPQSRRRIAPADYSWVRVTYLDGFEGWIPTLNPLSLSPRYQTSTIDTSLNANTALPPTEDPNLPGSVRARGLWLPVPVEDPFTPPPARPPLASGQPRPFRGHSLATNSERADQRESLASSLARSTATLTNMDSRKRRPDAQDAAPDMKRQRQSGPSYDSIDLSGDQEAEMRERERVEALRQQADTDSEPKSFSELTCIICMDNYTDLTATPCGHIFCHECLTQALRASERHNSVYGSCPVCRKSLKRTTKAHVIPLNFMTQSQFAKNQARRQAMPGL